MIIKKLLLVVWNISINAVMSKNIVAFSKTNSFIYKLDRMKETLQKNCVASEINISRQDLRIYQLDPDYPLFNLCTLNPLVPCPLEHAP